MQHHCSEQRTRTAAPSHSTPNPILLLHSLSIRRPTDTKHAHSSRATETKVPHSAQHRHTNATAMQGQDTPRLPLLQDCSEQHTQTTIALANVVEKPHVIMLSNCASNLCSVASAVLHALQHHCASATSAASTPIPGCAVMHAFPACVCACLLPCC